MMRLTLRTLLAYLDDILAPADTKIIGQKIQESPMAQLLVSRIREVMRRRRLTAPEVFGPEMGIDPNIVSQYLDNTLAADRYADVERVLLASDEMLAETAACHQVLALILGEPAEVPMTSRERLYALGPVESSSQLAVPESKSTVAGRSAHSIAAVGGAVSSNHSASHSSVDDDERITTLPDYLKPAPWSQRFFPSAIVALLVVLCCALLVPGLMTGLKQANTEIQRKVERDKNTVASNGKSRPDDTCKPASEVTATQVETNVPSEPGTQITVAANLPEGIDPNPPNDVSEDRPSKPTPGEKDLDLPASALLPSRPSREVAVVDEKVPPKPSLVEVVNDSPVVYGASDGVMIRYDDQQRHWFTVPHKTALKPGELISNLEPFDGVLEFEKIGIRTTLVGETVLKLLDSRQAGIQGMGIGRGRIILQGSRKDNSRPGTIGIAIGEDIWKLDLASSDSVCALEVTVRESTQFQKLNDYHWYQAMIYVLSGSVKWTNRNDVAQEIGDHMALNIIPERAATVRSNPISVLSPPDWCDAAKRRAQPLRKLQTVFEKSFDGDEPEGPAMLTLVKTSRNPKIAELAAKSLSAMDNYQALVETLAECTHEEARFAARDGLRQWLPMNPDYGPKLKGELDNHYSPMEAEAVYRMLWGFSREDVKDSKATSWLLMNSMRSQRLEIRELADFWVERLTGRKTEYRASGTATHRESQVRRLEELIERDNGLIKSQ